MNKRTNRTNETDVISHTNTALQVHQKPKQTNKKDDMTTEITRCAYMTSRKILIEMKHILALQITNEDPRQKLVITLINPPKTLTKRKTVTTQPDKRTLPVGTSHICLCSDWMRPNSGKELKLRLTMRNLHKKSNKLYPSTFGPKVIRNYLKPQGLFIDHLGRRTLILKAVNNRNEQKSSERTKQTCSQAKNQNITQITEKLTPIELEFVDKITKTKLCTCMKNEKHAELKDRITRVKTAQEQKHIASLTKIPKDENDTYVPQQADNVQSTANPNTSPVALLQANSEVQYT
jgi:hypothetical protein